MVCALLVEGVKDQSYIIPQSTKQKQLFDLNRSPPPDESEDERLMPLMENVNSNEETTKNIVNVKTAMKRLSWQKWYHAQSPEHKKVRSRLKSQRRRSNIRMRVSDRMKMFLRQKKIKNLTRKKSSLKQNKNF